LRVVLSYRGGPAAAQAAVADVERQQTSAVIRYLRAPVAALANVRRLGSAVAAGNVRIFAFAGSPPDGGWVESLTAPFRRGQVTAFASLRAGKDRTGHSVGGVPDIRRSAVADIDPVTLYRILWLRVTVFVVEQEAAYPEVDGRDIEPGAELMWIEEDGEVLATLRILRDHGAMRIGRVATAASARGRGHAAGLMRAAIRRCAEQAPDVPIDLDAQMQLEGWYARFGFERSGEPFEEDGIPHIPMRRA
jgi:ElaA protein